MYLPKLFAVTDHAPLLALMRGHPFATLVGLHDGEPEITHLPLLVREREGAVVLEGHVARGNPLAALVEAQAPLTAVFHGPHAYVSPRLYASPENVPTWNYAVVHARGRAVPMRDPAAVSEHLRALTATFEAVAPEPWLPERAGDLAQKLIPALVAFELVVEKLEAKFKLSQNRRPDDRAGVLRAFERGEPHERAVAALMQKHGHRD